MNVAMSGLLTWRLESSAAEAGIDFVAPHLHRMSGNGVYLASHEISSS